MAGDARLDAARGLRPLLRGIAALDLRDELAQIDAPTLVLLGREDPVVGDEAGQELGSIRGARIVALEAAHLANVEQPGALMEGALAA